MQIANVVQIDSRDVLFYTRESLLTCGYTRLSVLDILGASTGFVCFIYLILC